MNKLLESSVTLAVVCEIGRHLIDARQRKDTLS